MSAGIFIAGILVSLIVILAMGVLVWGLKLEASDNARDRDQSGSPGGTSGRSRSTDGEG